ncbi:MAG: glutamate-5-semialdehyde dehydrogenase [Phycisphaerales bacterium]|nr:glutamate-5-semialdehyde dehydrogenase [Planctomycetota bacterium]MCH8509767.1 glutamate-5-semialdehyde dehydrogenase [Phycisphaerales bacterium]
MTARIEEIARAARRASALVGDLSGATRDAVLLDLAERIRTREADILAANAQDMDAARAARLDAPKLRRLALTPDSLGQMRAGLCQVAALPDPVGRVTRSETVASGLRVEKVRSPLGVIAMIYEARPGVTVDAFALCFKAGNACLLKGGREADRSNRVLAGLIRESLAAAGAPEDAMSAITSSDRDELRRMLTLSAEIDLVIPRGGEALIRFVHEHARIPTIQHFKGVCHVFVDEAADLDKALEIVATGKAGAPATCNATECVLVHRAVADAFLPRLIERAARDGVTIRGDGRVLAAAAGASHVEPAGEGDWGAEFLDLVLAARVVDGFEDALAHIHAYTSDHTEAIVTEDAATAEAFCRRVRSSCVLVNASTRFNDGFQLGLGAEIGISTSRIHAYGPMGLEGVTIERFVVRGEGQVR